MLLKEEVMQLGDVMIYSNLPNNVMQYAFYCLENYEQPIMNKYYNLYFISLSAFFELFFKYKISLINPSLIWDNPMNYNEAKHNIAEFKSISAELASRLALNFKWIDENEFQLLKKIKAIRNKYQHFSVGEIDENGDFYSLKFNEKEIDTAIELMRKLLRDNKSIFENDPTYHYLIHINLL